MLDVIVVSDIQALVKLIGAKAEEERKTLMLRSLQSLYIGQQYQWLQEMQRTHRIWQDEETGEWHIFRYDDAKYVLSDYATFSSVREPDTEVRREFMNNSFLMMDPPEHRRYRGLVASVFTPRAITHRAERIKAIVQEQLDRVRASGSMEFVSDLAYPVPVTIIAEFLGLPAEDHDRFRGWVHLLFSQENGIDENTGTNLHRMVREKLARRSQANDGAGLPQLADERIQRGLLAAREMNKYFLQQIEERRQSPHEDLITGLVQAELDGERLTTDEILGFCRLLLVAGHASTVGLLSTVMLCLDEYPEIQEQLRQQPELVPLAIEEVLRYAFVLKPLRRRTTTEALIGEVHIPANSTVHVWLAAANHDPAQFPDPERFNIRRSPNRHLTFGHGIHACIGAPLARQEAVIALPMMLEQLPQMRRVPGSPLEIMESGSFLWFRQLPITFSSSPSHQRASR